MLLATVKGDVHDIGKNIVGTVLACNDFEVIDLGVLVPCEKNPGRSQETRGASDWTFGIDHSFTRRNGPCGERDGARRFRRPAADCGATTSAKHTAVKIAPHYRREVSMYWMRRESVPVVERLVNPESRASFAAETKAKQDEERASFAMRRDRKLVDYREAQQRKLALDWATYTPPRPAFTGSREIQVSVAELRPISIGPVLHDLGAEREISQDFPRQAVGAIAKELYDDAQVILDQFEKDPTIALKGTYGFFSAASLGDTIVLYTDDSRSTELARLEMLRQQWERVDQKAFRSLADYVAPPSKPDYVGAFAVTAGHGVDEMAKSLRAKHEDGKAILVQACADRLAEAFAEWLHERVRREWGFDESLSKEDLIDEKYRESALPLDIRPCPDHTEKAIIWKILDVEKRCGMTLTESYAMWPAASVSASIFPTRSSLFRGRPNHPRSSRGLCKTQRLAHLDRRALASSEPRLRCAMKLTSVKVTASEDLTSVIHLVWESHRSRARQHVRLVGCFQV